MQEEEANEAGSSSGIRNLIVSIDKMAGKLSKDIDLIAAEEQNPDGTEVELSAKLVDTFLKMVEKIDKIKNYMDVVSEMNPDQPAEVGKDGVVIVPVEKVAIIKPGENAFEAAINHAKKKQTK